MKKIIVLFLVLLVAVPVSAQRRQGGERYHPEGFYGLLGGTVGPSFSEFFDYIKDTYPSSKLKNFGGNVSFSVGYISRFHRNFAVDVGFSIYSLRTKGVFSDTGNLSSYQIHREFDYQAAIFTGTIPIYFEFSPGQPVVPYIGIGISIFSMRFDDYKNNYTLRDSRVAVGGHFQAGVGVKLTPRIWLDARGRWHGGSAHLSTFENNSHDFTIKQNVAQYGLGIDYFFR
jgi:opacity protein-like surface antigen